MSELIEVRYNQNIFYMTPLQIEAAYEYQKRQYQMQDCREHLEEIVFGESTDLLEEFEKRELEKVFFDRYGMEYADALELLVAMTDRFEKKHDCNIDENTAWDIAITDVLIEYRNNTRR